MDKKLIKAFTKLNNAIDAELDKSYTKLSDRFHNLELSHNRKKTVLTKLYNELYLELWRSLDSGKNGATISIIELQKWLKMINDALFCDGRVNSSLVQRKK